MAVETDPISKAAALPICERDQQEIRHIYQQIRSRRAKLVGPDGEAQSLPSDVYSFLLRLLADMNEGRSVTILQENAALTTVQASQVLGVSRQFLINVLKRGDVPHHMVGTHRRMYARDVLLFKAKRDAERKKGLEDLMAAEMDEGIFDRMPANDRR
jgi:excisionase family DNA binding protein